MKIFHVYILLCSDGSYYTGVTSDFNKRIEKHENAYYLNSYTSKRLPVKLVWHSEFSDPYSAITMEKRIKSWSRNKKEALIDGDFDLLQYLAKKKFE